MKSPKPIIIQKLTEDETWETISKTHASVNKASGSAYLGSGSEQSSSGKTFTIRYRPELADIQFNKQSYRIIYGNVIYTIDDYDDYLEKHISIRLLGVSRGVKI